MKLPDRDFQLIRTLRSPQFSALEKVDGLKLDQRNGTIVIFCSDCDQSFDIISHLVDLQREQRTEPRIHLFAHHGGPLRIPQRSPLNIPGRGTDKDIMESIEEAMGLKGISTIKLLAHTPCGKARKHGLGTEESLRLLEMARVRVTDRFKSATVVSLLQVDYTSRPERGCKKPKCTYRVAPKNFSAWLAINQPTVR